MNKFSLLSLALILSSGSMIYAQTPYVSSAWVADLGNGKYQNPILHADYSDPDAIRVGDDYYMTASSFNHAPGLPILHSKDLVNWEIVSHALPRQIPEDVFNTVQHGNGVWAPSIRYHEGEYYIYWGDPDFGIYMVKTKDPAGDWSEPTMVLEGKGLIDPCPFWDEDGNNYMSFAYAGSRAGLKSVVVMTRLNATGTKALDRGTIIYDGHEDDPTIEGTKMHKRNGYYYLFAPAGGVATGWQLVLRSKHIYGPYERHVAMHQGSAPTNGPHQGAWVDTQTGEDWFIHFQDKEAYGRVVHLQPMKWENDWPVIGVEKDVKGTGEPVITYQKPDVGKTYPIETPVESDEFDSPLLGKQWQWQANPDGTWLMPSKKGHLTLYTKEAPKKYNNLLDVPHVLTQKFPAEEFKATAKLRLIASDNEKLDGERAGFAVVGEDYSQLFVRHSQGKQTLHFGVCQKGLTGGKETTEEIAEIPNQAYIYLRVEVQKGAICQWSYSLDGKKYTTAGEKFTAVPGKWIGATLGLYALRDQTINDSGYAEVDWFRVEPLK